MRYLPVGLIGIVALVGALGCNRDLSTASRTYTMAGMWFQSSLLTDSVHGESHLQMGNYAIDQSADSTFAGTGEQSGACHGAAGTFTGPLASIAQFSVSNGKFTGNVMSFDTPYCHFEGAFEYDNPSKMTGVATCSYVQDAVTHTFAGQWQAYR